MTTPFSSGAPLARAEHHLWYWKLFLSLALSDLAEGFFTHIRSQRSSILEVNSILELLCPVILTLCNVILYLPVCATFLNVIAIAVDRFLAVSLHLRYQELVTSKRVTVALVRLQYG